MSERYPHYFKPCPYDHVDVYRVLLLFGVTDPALQHAIKKLLVAGGRGQKDITQDVQEAIDTLERWQAMRAEEHPEPERALGISGIVDGNCSHYWDGDQSCRLCGINRSQTGAQRA